MNFIQTNKYLSTDLKHYTKYITIQYKNSQSNSEQLLKTFAQKSKVLMCLKTLNSNVQVGQRCPGPLTFLHLKLSDIKFVSQCYAPLI